MDLDKGVSAALVLVGGQWEVLTSIGALAGGAQSISHFNGPLSAFPYLGDIGIAPLPRNVP